MALPDGEGAHASARRRVSLSAPPVLVSMLLAENMARFRVTSRHPAFASAQWRLDSLSRAKPTCLRLVAE